MKKYLIYAYEDMYQGLHGMYNLEVIDGDKKLEDVYNIASDLSMSVIEDYTYDQLTDIAEEDGCDLDMLIEDNIAYSLFSFDSDKDNRELEDECYTEGLDIFCNKYNCISI